MSVNKLIAVNFDRQIHHLDHIAIIAIIMNIPLIASSTVDEWLGRRYYPGLRVLHFKSADESKDFLETCDAIFDSLCYDRKVLEVLYRGAKEKYDRTVWHVHCPHGFSDKAYWFDLCLKQDCFLAYGQSMLNMLNERNPSEKLPPFVVTGNYRYQYYLQHKEFYDTVANQEIFSYFQNKAPIVLYAPSWTDLETKTSFFDAAEIIIDHLPEYYNLLIKLHPLLMENDIINMHRIIAKCANRKNILCLYTHPFVYPILDKIDIYLGDTSSIGYDFLVFNKPLFFLKPQNLSKEKDTGQRFHLGTVCSSLLSLSIRDNFSETSTDSVPIKIGRPCS